MFVRFIRFVKVGILPNFIKFKNLRGNYDKRGEDKEAESDS